MIKLTRIAQENPFKLLREQINAAMARVEGDQPQLGMPLELSIDYYGIGRGSFAKHVAISAPNAIDGSLLLQCLPETIGTMATTMVTDVNGCLVVTAEPKLDGDTSVLSFSLARINFHAIKLANSTARVFRMPHEYGYQKPDNAFGSEFGQVIATLTSEPLYPLGLKGILAYAPLETTPVRLFGPAYMYVDTMFHILINAEYPPRTILPGT